MMTMPKPQCGVCQCVMTFADDVIGGDTGYWFCETHPLEMLVLEDAQAAYITTLEAELTALRQQVAALQTAKAREPLGIEWCDNSNHLSLDDLIDEELAAATVAENATVDQPTE